MKWLLDLYIIIGATLAMIGIVRVVQLEHSLPRDPVWVGSDWSVKLQGETEWHEVVVTFDPNGFVRWKLKEDDE